jgi:hypothetical protein
MSSGRVEASPLELRNRLRRDHAGRDAALRFHSGVGGAPEHIARELNVSTRTLARIFAGRNESVMRTVFMSGSVRPLSY